jgi:hypothetical protein
MKDIRIAMLYGFCIICLAAPIMPAAGALGNGTSWSDNPEHIIAMKAYVAYAGEDYQAKMTGAISYVGSISGSAGTGDLTGTKKQFTATAASVQSMTSSEAIEAARARMKGDIATFHANTIRDMKQYNGSIPALHASVNASVAIDQATIDSLDTAWWTAREHSRLDEFAYNDARRTGALANLSAKGVDVSQAQKIETQISGLQGSLKSALDARDEKELARVDTQLGLLGRQFWAAVSGDAWQAGETRRFAEFDNRTTSLHNELASLKGRGINVTGAQEILDRISSERDPLKGAFDNHDSQDVQVIDTRLTGLYKQFRTTVQGYLTSDDSKTQSNERNTTRNASFREGMFRSTVKPVVTGGNAS